MGTRYRLQESLRHDRDIERSREGDAGEVQADKSTSSLEVQMKIGVFGGSFDPLHLGHLLLAETVRETCALDEVWLTPAFQSPLKAATPRATPRQRVEMLRLAVAGFPPFRLHDREIKRKGISYTVETLADLAKDRPDAELSLIIGADALADFPRWRDPDQILKFARVIAVNRGEAPASLENVRKSLGESQLARFQIVSMPMIDLSSTRIRERVAAGKSIRYQTLRAVEQYIHQHQLYLPEPVDAGAAS